MSLKYHIQFKKSMYMFLTRLVLIFSYFTFSQRSKYLEANLSLVKFDLSCEFCFLEMGSCEAKKKSMNVAQTSY